jgi:signal transduction histidine kinase
MSKCDSFEGEFLQVVLSELRDLLQSLRMALHALTEGYVGELDEKQIELVLSARAFGEQIDDLVAGLIELAELKSGKYKLFLERLRPIDVVRASVFRQRPQAESKNIKLINRVWSGTPYVMADRQALNRILNYLLSNAINLASRDGEIIIESWERNGFVFISVRGDIECCSSAGAELELVLIKCLIKLHGGHLSIESSSAAGASFTFTIPIAGSA